MSAASMVPPDPPAQSTLVGRAVEILETHWRPEGYTSPNPQRYPWQWLWDSCFHAIVWAHLGDARCLTEMRTVFAGQDTSGFVPHMGYQLDPGHHAEFWGRPGWSSITQPPMYGHALAELASLGVDVPGELCDAAAAGLWFLLRDRRRSPAGLVELVHPWESGADDSPRWDDLMGGPVLGSEVRRQRKGELLSTVERRSGAPIVNPAFRVGAVAFSALVAFNASRLAELTGELDLARSGAELAEAVARRWDDTLCTWVDDGPTEAGSGRIRTLEALAAVLVDPDPSHTGPALASLVDRAAHGAPYGPTGVHRDEEVYDPGRYWRGGAWPQLTYLLWWAARRHGADRTAASLGASLRSGALRSGFAEHWHPDTAAAGGAVPQSWTTLAVCVE
jgi:hypothetical protein